MQMKLKKPTANQRTGGCASQTIMWAVVVLGAIFADVMFISLIQSALPGGIMGAAAIVGAFVTSLSIIGLVMGKTHWFRPGHQIWAAWGFTGLEIVVAILNVITAIAYARHQPLGVLTYWLDYGAPCTPFVAVIGWISIAFFDPAREALHKQMEMEDETRTAELGYLQAAHEAHMSIMHTQLEQFTGFLQEFASSPENREAARQAAARMGRQVLGNVTGMPIANSGSPFIYQLPQPKEVAGELAPQSTNSVARPTSPLDQPTLDPTTTSPNQGNGNNH